MRLIDYISLFGPLIAIFLSYKEIKNKQFFYPLILLSLSLSWFYWFPSLGYIPPDHPTYSGYKMEFPYVIMPNLELAHTKSVLANKLRPLLLIGFFLFFRPHSKKLENLIIGSLFLLLAIRGEFLLIEKFLWLVVFYCGIKHINKIDTNKLVRVYVTLLWISFGVGLCQFYGLLNFSAFSTIPYQETFVKLPRANGLFINSIHLGLFAGFAPFMALSFRKASLQTVLVLSGYLLVLLSHSRIGTVLFFISLFLTLRKNTCWNWIPATTVLLVILSLYTYGEKFVESEQITNFQRTTFLSRLVTIQNYKIANMIPLLTGDYSKSQHQVDPSLIARVNESARAATELEQASLMEKIFGMDEKIKVFDSSVFLLLSRAGFVGLTLICLFFFYQIHTSGYNLALYFFTSLFIALGFVSRFWEYTNFFMVPLLVYPFVEGQILKLKETFTLGRTS